MSSRQALLGTSIAIAFLGAGCGGSEAASIGFGTGGTDCELQGEASTFSPGTTVHMVASFDPTPSSVTVMATKDGTPLEPLRSVDLDGTVPCIYADIANVRAGHYEFVVTNPESKLPPLAGGFDVLP